MARYLTQAGATVVAISDSRHAIFSERGIDVESVAATKSARRSLDSLPADAIITNDTLLELAVDILIPAAIENQIHDDNAANIRAKTILELANGPTTPAADPILHERGIEVVPDILANAGGVTVSYYEQVQNAQNEYWTTHEVDEKLRVRMTAAFDAVYDHAHTHGTYMRNAAIAIGMERVAEVVAVRGFGG